MGSKRKEEAINRLDDKSTNKIAKLLQFGSAAISNFRYNELDELKKIPQNKDSSESSWGANERQSSQGTQSSTMNKPTQERGGSVTGNQAYFGLSKSNVPMKVTLGMEKGEYVLKLNTGMTDQAQTEAILSSQAAMLRRLGETLIFLSEVFKSLG